MYVMYVMYADVEDLVAMSSAEVVAEVFEASA
jgi:hypothetical protein